MTRSLSQERPKWRPPVSRPILSVVVQRLIDRGIIAEDEAEAMLALLLACSDLPLPRKSRARLN
nr:hypothetical protein [uncultured Gellertiella sp.]